MADALTSAKSTELMTQLALKILGQTRHQHYFQACFYLPSVINRTQIAFILLRHHDKTLHREARRKNSRLNMTINRNADLLHAARELIVAIHKADSPQQRHRLLQQVTSLLSDKNFPALIKLFVIVGESDDTFAKKSLANALADTLIRGDIPSAPLAAWGSVSLGKAALARGFSAGARLDPLEYLCAWYSQRAENNSHDDSPTLSPESFARALEALIEVFTGQPDFAQRYRDKLSADLENSHDGAMNAATHKLLKQITDDWQKGVSPRSIAERASGAKRASGNIADLARAQLLGSIFSP